MWGQRGAECAAIRRSARHPTDLQATITGSICRRLQGQGGRVARGGNSEPMSKPTYHVTGSLIAADTDEPMEGYSVIAETGDRDELSPLCLEAIRAGRPRTDAKGRFEATFFTTGASLGAQESVPIPRLIEVHIQFSPGVWRCRELPIGIDQVAEQGDREVRIDLGRIKVDFNACREPKGKRTRSNGERNL